MFDISERKKTEEKLLVMQRQLEDFSFRDGLTGVPNRRKFDAVLDEEWGEARRNTQPLSLILIDIDFFKQYNDHYGHVQGDECLKRVGEALGTVANRPARPARALRRRGVRAGAAGHRRGGGAARQRARAPGAVQGADPARGVRRSASC